MRVLVYSISYDMCIIVDDVRAASRRIFELEYRDRPYIFQNRVYYVQMWK